MPNPSGARFKIVYVLIDLSTLKEANALRDLLDTDADVRPISVPGLVPALLKQVMLPFIANDALLVGFGLCGSVAAYLQEQYPEKNLSVMAINAPTGTEWWKLERKMENRAALYSSLYEPNRGQNLWTDLAGTNLDVPWLQHGVFSDSGGNLSKNAVAYFVSAYIQNRDLTLALDSFSAV